MDLQVIKALIDAFAASNLAEMEYRADGATLRLVKRAASAAPAPGQAVDATTDASPGEPAAAAQPEFAQPEFAQPEGAQPGPSAAPAAFVTTPLHGLVHLQRMPDAPPFVAAGQAVAAGQVLCAIEAMKTFTEIRAERDCTIAEVLVATGQEVDAGQPLFRLG
jgi:acetyl-CoA carboxylase biotin carboxyl carrier protein